MTKKIKMPAPVTAAIKKALKTANADIKAILNAVLTSAENLSFRFQALPDEARQAIRVAVVADCKAMTYGSMTACAIEYGITPPNLTKWLREDRQGIKVIRGRGRKAGTKNTWNHKTDKNGNPILVPFKPKKKKVRVVGVRKVGRPKKVETVIPVTVKKSIKKIGAIKKVGKLATATTPVKKIGTIKKVGVAVKAVKPTAKVKPHKVKPHPKAK